MALGECECEVSEEGVPAEDAVADDGIVVPYDKYQYCMQCGNDNKQRVQGGRVGGGLTGGTKGEVVHAGDLSNGGTLRNTKFLAPCLYNVSCN